MMKLEGAAWVCPVREGQKKQKTNPRGKIIETYQKGLAAAILAKGCSSKYWLFRVEEFMHIPILSFLIRQTSFVSIHSSFHWKQICAYPLNKHFLRLKVVK